MAKLPHPWWHRFFTYIEETWIYDYPGSVEAEKKYTEELNLYNERVKEFMGSAFCNAMFELRPPAIPSSSKAFLSHHCLICKEVFHIEKSKPKTVPYKQTFIKEGFKESPATKTHRGIAK